MDQPFLSLKFMFLFLQCNYFVFVQIENKKMLNNIWANLITVLIIIRPIVIGI